MITLYGIPNCQTVKKARNWLQAHNIDFTFVDFKKIPPTSTQIHNWLKDVSINTLLNKKGTTWRKLDSQEQERANTTDGAISLLCQYPSMIKRPVLVQNNQPVQLGFSDEMYQNIFSLTD